MAGKVVAIIMGGLGNQLFCYAAARRLALRNDADLVLDHQSGFLRDFVYRRKYELDHFAIPCRQAGAFERLEPFSRLRRYAKKRWNRIRPFRCRTYVEQEGIDFDPRILQIVPMGTIYLDGYWQSEGYFKDVEEIIRRDLWIKPPTDTWNLEMARRINSQLAVAIHVRFFDEPASCVLNGTLSDYYAKAIAYIDLRIAGAHYFLFSDRPESARRCVHLPDRRVTMVGRQGDENAAYADLWLMTQCRHFIIADSTFSWWGAWLAQSPGKMVIAPGFERREGESAWGFIGLIPPEWLAL